MPPSSPLDNVDAWSDDTLIEEFRRVRQETYG